MSETKKAVRLSKAARELNVGISTIVDYLNKEGIDIDAKPNTKVEPEVYDKLVDQFQTDQKLKEQSKKANLTREERKTISLESSKKGVEEDEEDEDEEEVEVESAETAAEAEETEAETTDTEETTEEVEEEEESAESSDEPEKEKESDADIIEVDVPEESKAEEKEEEKEEAPEEPIAEEEAAEGEKNPRVVGKIDLNKLNQKTRPDKKSKKDKEKEAEEKKKAEKVAKEKAEKEKAEAEKAAKAEKEAKEAADKKASDEKKAEDEKSSVIRAGTTRLSGPNVVGKIELPKDDRKKKKPVASSSDTQSKKKRKRKRISKVDVGKQGDRKGQGPGQGKKGGKKGQDRPEVTEADIQKEIKETLARLSGGGKSKSSKLRKAKREAVAQRSEEEAQKQQEEEKTLKLTEFVTVSELANMMDKSPTDIIGACMSLGIFASINQRLDAETITIIAEEFGYDVEFVSADVQEAIQVEEDDPEDLQPRPPIVTVMGHVDHGKTSLLDHIRKANVIAGEAGGITQHIGAYNVEIDNGKRITFLDTPGHEAFTAMRARGAQVTDLAIIVIAADDNVMPQTKEAINHAQAAGIPMIFALNKIDKPDANPDRIREELSQMNILLEEWGGKFQSQEISAKKGQNVDDLLEKVLLEAELLDLKANPDKRAHGTVIEATLDVGRGYVTTLLVEAGTLRVGDPVLAGQWSGKVKAMHNERGQAVDEVGPAMPVSILGMDGAPYAGDKFYVLEDERESRNIANRRQQLQREQGVRAQKHITIEEIGRRIAIGEFQELNLIVKGDVDGSVEALTDALQKLSTEKVQVNVIHRAVGAITESDVLLASASDAIILGFQVRPSASARKLAEKEEIQIRHYSVIYAAIDEMKKAMEGLLSAKIEEKVVGTAEVRDVFKISKVGTIAGCFVLEGKITRNSKVRVIREGIVVYTGELGSLKRFKDDVKEVKKGFECGLNVDKFNDIKEGDHIEAYEEVEVKQTL
ncbi:translation initiation factor IF-2 [Halocola ammonii]